MKNIPTLNDLAAINDKKALRIKETMEKAKQAQTARN